MRRKVVQELSFNGYSVEEVIKDLQSIIEQYPDAFIEEEVDEDWDSYGNKHLSITHLVYSFQEGKRTWK